MGIFKRLIIQKTAMTYEYHGQLYWNTVLERVTNQYQKVVQNNDNEYVNRKLLTILHIIMYNIIKTIRRRINYVKRFKGCD